MEATFLLMVGTGFGWVVKTIYSAWRERSKLRARTFVRRGTQDGIPNRRLLIFDIINYGKEPVVITDLAVFVERFRVLRQGVDMQGIRGDHGLPYNLQPGETLSFQVDAWQFADELLFQGANNGARVRARFTDASRRHHYGKRTFDTLDKIRLGAPKRPQTTITNRLAGLLALVLRRQ